MLLAILRASANRLWSTARPTLPTVVSPAASDEPPHDDDHFRESNPEIDDLTPALGAPYQLLMSVMLGASAFDYPTSCGGQRRRLVFLGDHGEKGGGL